MSLPKGEWINKEENQKKYMFKTTDITYRIDKLG